MPIEGFLYPTIPAGIASNPEGTFFVAWRGRDENDAGGYVIRARVFGADGTPRGPALLVSESDARHREEPRVAVTPSGSFVVAWSEQFAEAPNRSTLQFRRYGADAVPLGDEILVTDTGDNRTGVVLLALLVTPLDEAVAIWDGSRHYQVDGQTRYVRTTFLRSFASTGIPLSDPVLLFDDRDYGRASFFSGF